MNIHKAWLVFKKDWLEIKRNWQVLLPIIILPIIFSVIFPVIVAGNLKYTHNKHVNIRFPIANPKPARGRTSANCTV